MNLYELYYNKFLNLFVEEYKRELMQNTPGYCMKVTGLPLNKLKRLYDLIRALNPALKIFILSEELTGEMYITPTKLIELRNDQHSTLLALLPVNSRTSAEDSYGDATFKDLSVLPVEYRLIDRLRADIPAQFETAIDEVFTYLKDKRTQQTSIQYLLFQELKGYTQESIGNGIFLFGLLPDEDLAKDLAFIRKDWLLM